MAFKQQERQPLDGAISVSRDGVADIVVSVTTNGVDERICMSEFNASRVLGSLALMLGVRLNAQDAKAIKF